MRDRAPRDEAARDDENGPLGQRGEMLRLAVAVLVRNVRGADRDPDREEREQRRNQIGSGVQRLGDQSEAVRRQAGAELERDEHDGRDHRDERRSPLRMHSASKTEEPAEAGSSSIFRPEKLRAGDVAVEALLERRARALPAVLPVADDQPGPISAAIRRGVVVVELAIGAVRRSVTREGSGRTEERSEEVTGETGSSAGRVLVEDAAGDRAFEVAVEAARHACANELAVLALVRLAVARAVPGHRGEGPLVDAAQAEGAVAVVMDLVRPLLVQRRPRLRPVAPTVGRRQGEAELVLPLSLAFVFVLSFAARTGEAGRGERQGSGDQGEDDDHPAHVLFHSLCLGFPVQSDRCRRGRRLAVFAATLGGAEGSSEIAAEGLLALDRLEERLEVPLAEPACAVALDHLEEESRPVLRGLREDLQQVPILVPVDEDAQATQVVPVFTDLADTRHRILVVGLRSGEELDAEFLQRLDAAHDVLGLQRDVLHAGAAEELEVLLDLALA